MGSPEQTITDLSGFLRIANELSIAWFPHEKTWGPWFRGHSVGSWGLVPKLYRYTPRERNLRIIEDELRQEFAMRAPGLTNEKIENGWDWYFVMQHSGCPTRLLDWTEGALIALYFAVRDGNKGEDAAVWAIDPWWLNKHVVGEREVIPPSAVGGLLSADASRYAPWLPARFDHSVPLKDYPVAVYPTHIARRIGTQRSCFTVHGAVADGFEILRKEKDARIVKIDVTASSVGSIEQQLSIAGIDEVTIYPDLDGLGRFLASALQDESVP
jgi:FRG domain